MKLSFGSIPSLRAFPNYLLKAVLQAVRDETFSVLDELGSLRRYYSFFCLALMSIPGREDHVFRLISKQLPEWTVVEDIRKLLTCSY